MVKKAMAMKGKLNEIDNKLKKQIINVEYKCVKIQVNAKNEFLSLNIPESLLHERKDKIEKTILYAFEEARQKAQNIMAEEAKNLMLK
ncbi:MAG: YbaB/EbfC family nucleoid-associated protein [Endomicrobium sp.]|jgi:DNA-binding protein YbaB|nr:YbaB/EbfC family nucleoid-associated protein [Endomicrobium sp.]